MKKIITIFIATSFFTVSCNKDLDLQPTQAVSEASVFTSSANVLAALNGAYDVASGGYLLGGDLQLYAELLGSNEEISFVGTYNEPQEIASLAILTNNNYVRRTWEEAYKAINICNNIIAHIDIVKDDERDRVKGEALFLRGLMYFELVELFGKPYSAGNITSNLGVQLITTPTVNGNIEGSNLIPRSTIKETYDRILADLIESKNLMSSDVGVYASKWAAAGILSRVYLQMADYDNARKEANDVIENSGASLEGEYSKAFNNTDPSSEDIFVLPITAQDGDNDLHLFWSTLDYGARDGDVEINQKHLDLYEPGDARLALFHEENGTFYSGKWLLQYKYIPLIRLGEMYLTRAECNFRLGGTPVGATPQADVDIIRDRAALGPIVITLDNIIDERRREIADEGQRIHDVKRLKQTVTVSGVDYPYDANETVFPIPIREINSSSQNALVQNPGYQ
jgi:hypothetical protein